MLDPTNSLSLPLPDTAQPEHNETETIPLPALSDKRDNTSEAALRPFIVRLHRKEETKGGTFRPSASMELSPTLRTSGLLQALPAEDLKHLILLLTFLSPNGDCAPAISQVADALQTTETAIRARLAHLTAFLWQGEPIVRILPRETGMDAVTLSSHLIAFQHDPPASFNTRPPITAVGREAIIAHSRAIYARPRTDVEREIAEQMGWDYPATADEEAICTPVEYAVTTLRRRLLTVGVAKEQADALLSRYELADIEQQLDWLPYRHAKIPAKFVVAAIMGRYEVPPMLRAATPPVSPEIVPAPTSPVEGAEQSPGDPPSVS